MLWQRTCAQLGAAAGDAAQRMRAADCSLATPPWHPSHPTLSPHHTPPPPPVAHLQGMSYANLAGLPYAFGLYGAFVPCIVYAFLGSSRQLVRAACSPSRLAIVLTCGSGGRHHGCGQRGSTSPAPQALMSLPTAGQHARLPPSPPTAARLTATSNQRPRPLRALH